MLNHDTLCHAAGRWILAVILAVFIISMTSATQQAPAQDASDATVAPIESTTVEAEAAKAASAESDTDDEIVFDGRQDRELNSTENSYTEPDTAKMLGRFVLAIMVVLIILAVVLMVYQKLSRRSIKLTGSDRPLRIVDKLALAPKQSVCLLNVCDRYLLLGVAEKEISVLTEVTLPGDSDDDGDFEQTLKTLGISKHDTIATKATS